MRVIILTAEFIADSTPIYIYLSELKGRNVWINPIVFLFGNLFYREKSMDGCSIYVKLYF